MIRSRSLARAVQAATILALLCAAMLPSRPVAAWNNGGLDPGYGTHDWVIDAALRVVDGRVNEWFDAGAARLASDDPDTNRSAENDHVYRNVGARGGAVHRITEHHAAAVRLYKAGVAARAGGNEATARAQFTSASIEIGRLAHYLSDIAMPWHSAYEGVGAAGHVEYEILVGQQTRRATDRPDWVSPRRTVTALTDVRPVAINMAAFSRPYFAELYAIVTADSSHLSARAAEITRVLMFRIANDLADIIWSVEAGTGVGPPVGRLDLQIKHTYPKAGEPWQGVFVTATDVNGRPMEGLQVRVTLPLPYGSTRLVYLYTDHVGYTKWSGPVGDSPPLVKQNVTAVATTDGRSATATGWWAIASPSGGTVVEPYRGWYIDIWGSKFRDDIVWLAEQKITAGCADLRFCPDGRVTRAQMASFLVRALDLPASSRNWFGDDDTNKHQANINALAASGITVGCAPGRFCPDGVVTREQMATFLVRGLELAASSRDFFADDNASKHEPRINALAASGITSGCATGRFCPTGVVTRGQMAAFLHRGLTD